jgi:hypothetical protein
MGHQRQGFRNGSAAAFETERGAARFSGWRAGNSGEEAQTKKRRKEWVVKPESARASLKRLPAIPKCGVALGPWEKTGACHGSYRLPTLRNQLGWFQLKNQERSCFRTWAVITDL